MNLFDDDLFLEPDVTNARVAGKFQPKVKPRPKKIAPKSTSSTLPNSEKAQPTLVPSYGPETAQSSQHVDVVGNKMRNLVGSLEDASAVSGTNEPFKGTESSFSDGSENAQCAKVAMFDDSHNLNSSILKSVRDYMPILDDDLFLEPAITDARGSVKSQPEDEPQPKMIVPTSVSSTVPISGPEHPTLLPNSGPETTQFENPVDIFVSSAATSEIQGAEDDIRNSGLVNDSSKPGAKDVTNSENTMPDRGACSTGEHPDVFFGLEVLDDFLAQPPSGMVHATGKIHHETSNLSASNKDTSKEKSGIPDHVSVDSSAFTERGVISDFDSQDTMPEASIASDRLTSEFQLNEEPKNHAETSHIDDAMFEDTPRSEDVPLKKMGAKSRKRKNSTVSNNSQKSKKPSAGEKGEKGKSLRQPRKGVAACELIDESDDEAHDKREFHTETPSTSAVDVVEDGNDDCSVGSASKKKRAPRKKPVADSEKKFRKRKRANKETDQSTNQPPKKFSHSTRRTRRQVDKTLLETPEDDLELTKVPIRDLIMLYLHKERMENKEAKSKKPSTNQSADNETSHNEEETFGTENNSDFYENQGAEAVQMTSPFFNYHSYMDKTRSSKWSKQDDELFYKCIQQFGIDLSMIQLVFPDRTRRQIKLKLKKEERQHPLRLTEAVQNRAKDHSQFELIIEQLKQAGGKGEEECDGSESIGVTGEEEDEELAPENNDEVTKGGQEVEAEAEDTTVKVDNPPPPPDEFDEIEDDFDINDYRSEY